VAKASNSFGLGRVTLSRLLLVAQRGTGPVSVSWTEMSRAAAASNSPSSRHHVPGGYALGSAASKSGRRLERGDGANSCQ
jgi:hypothetical protein